jgi:archaellum component FlaC
MEPNYASMANGLSLHLNILLFIFSYGMSAEAKEKSTAEKTVDDKLAPVWDCLDDFLHEIRGLEQAQENIKKEYEALKEKVKKIEKHLKIINSESP